MARKSKEERRAALKRRTQGAVRNRDVSKYGGNDVLDLSKSGKKGKVNMYKVQSGKKKNVIDILPFVVSQKWYSKLRTFNGKPVGLEPGDEEYKVEYAVHRNVGPEKKNMLCLREMFGQPCEACAQRDAEYQKDDPDEKVLDALKPTWRCLYNVYDYNEPEKDIQIWDYSRYLFEATLLEEAENDEDGIVLFSDVEEGKTLRFKGREKNFGKAGNSYVEVSQIDFEDREPYSDDIVEDTYPLDAMLVVPTPEEFTAAFLGLDIDNEDDDEEEAERPAAARRRPRKAKAKAEPELDEEEKADDVPFDEDCPFGLEFGADCDSDPACEDCPDDVFTACAKKQDEMEEKKTSRRRPKKDDEEEAERPAAARRRPRKAKAEPEEKSRRVRRRR